MNSARVQVVRAPNPSPMTLDGTNSYLLYSNDKRALCIDPGPAIGSHVEALLAATRERGACIDAIVVTHGHPDHYPAAARLAAASHAPIYAHPRAVFAHDRTLADGDAVHMADLTLMAIDAPGHTRDHLVLYERQEGALFTGDVVLGTGTVVIAPPGGDMRLYQVTLQRLLDEHGDARIIYGGHGPPVHDVAAKLREYIDHRRMRETQLLRSLENGPQTIPALVATIYADVSRTLWPAAARQMLAYLLALENEARVRSTALPRALTREENAILNPSWASLVGKEQAETIEAELGAMLRLEQVREYALT